MNEDVRQLAAESGVLRHIAGRRLQAGYEVIELAFDHGRCVSPATATRMKSLLLHLSVRAGSTRLSTTIRSQASLARSSSSVDDGQ